ncbi:pantetheine-phosphate adenylyltransferase [Acidaminococcus sp. LBK-2]|uniref:pantetheine-phosphate adenylyltransferase n=1 Tax=Acidaminococcus TaxID=904 RepID=UPI00242B7874|nr:pantetheine-phosphate adenylyltransferase [Acidaminococcus fermentans]
MRKAVCPGSFDPVTMGHLDIFERASRMFDELIISVFVNPTKDKAMFSMEERVAMIRKATAHIPNVRVTCFSGLLNEFCEQEGAKFIVRGLRAFTDFEYEFQRALLMKEIDERLETVFIMTNAKYSYLSSSGVREMVYFGGDITGFVPDCIRAEVMQRGDSSNRKTEYKKEG